MDKISLASTLCRDSLGRKHTLNLSTHPSPKASYSVPPRYKISGSATGLATPVCTLVVSNLGQEIVFCYSQVFFLSFVMKTISQVPNAYWPLKKERKDGTPKMCPLFGSSIAVPLIINEVAYIMQLLNTVEPLYKGHP